MMRNDVTVPSILKMVDLSIQKKSAALNRHVRRSHSIYKAVENHGLVSQSYSFLDTRGDILRSKLKW
jgi:hypothetical protein